jgi:DNA topoisomerase II
LNYNFFFRYITGLILNLFHEFWPSLLEKSGFIKIFIHPIVKIVHKETKEKQNFFNMIDFQNWKKGIESTDFTIKFYKTIGHFTQMESREVNLDSK